MLSHQGDCREFCRRERARAPHGLATFAVNPGGDAALLQLKAIDGRVPRVRARLGLLRSGKGHRCRDAIRLPVPDPYWAAPVRTTTAPLGRQQVYAKAQVEARGPVVHC